ncbi:MAG: DUF1759 domain-containing protein [Gammaproteobacteria bacterium]|nr:DUF1759 domain-containing protein [Gammaproteobacteria bacterium]
MDTHLPEATRLLGINLADANRLQLHDNLSRVKNHLRNMRTKIQEGLEKWDDEINQFEDEEIRNEKSDTFLQYRVNGTDATPGNVDELVENIGDLIVEIDHTIHRIMNPTFVPAFQVPVVPPVTVVGQESPVVPQQAEGDGDVELQAPVPPVIQLPIQVPQMVEEIRDIPVFQPPVGQLRQPVIQENQAGIVEPVNAAPIQVKLPKTELMHFSGEDPSEFPGFLSSFQYIIGQTNIAGASKFFYLKEALDPPAKNAITGLDFADESYQIALDILNERYGKKER